MSEKLAINIKNVTKEYPGVLALDGIDLQVKQGTIHGFLGPNGAGKSTTIKIISGIIPPTSGEVEILGQNTLNNPQALVKQIGTLPEVPPLYHGMKVIDYLNFVIDIHGGEGSSLTPIMRKCGISDVKNRLIGNLSKGFKQRVGIAQALVFNPPIVILDEPTVGLDPNAMSEIRDLILELKEDHTILLSSHLLHEVTKICDEITIINKGEILESGTLHEIQSKFQDRTSVFALVNRWTKDLQKQMMERFDLDRLSFEEVDGIFQIRFPLGGEDDKLIQYSKFLSEKAGLFEFKKETIELESIFKEIVK